MEDYPHIEDVSLTPQDHLYRLDIVYPEGRLCQEHLLGQNVCEAYHPLSQHISEAKPLRLYFIADEEFAGDFQSLREEWINSKALGHPLAGFIKNEGRLLISPRDLLLRDEQPKTEGFVLSYYDLFHMLIANAYGTMQEDEAEKSNQSLYFVGPQNIKLCRNVWATTDDDKDSSYLGFLPLPEDIVAGLRPGSSLNVYFAPPDIRPLMAMPDGEEKLVKSTRKVKDWRSLFVERDSTELQPNRDNLAKSDTSSSTTSTGDNHIALSNGEDLDVPPKEAGLNLDDYEAEARDQEGSDLNPAWKAVILPDSEGYPPTYLPVMLWRPYDKESGEWVDDRVFPAVRFGHGRDEHGAQDALKNADETVCWIKQDSHAKATEAILVHLDQLNTLFTRLHFPNRIFKKLKPELATEKGLELADTLGKLFLNNAPHTIPRQDIFAEMRENCPEFANFLNLEFGQLDAMELAKNAPANSLFFHGPPGTGKSHFIRQIIFAYLMFLGRMPRILLCCPNNEGVDRLAVMAQETLDSVQQDHLNAAVKANFVMSWYALRAHSTRTEEDVVKNMREEGIRQANSCWMPPKPTYFREPEPEDAQFLDQMLVINANDQEQLKMLEQSKKGTKDKRYKLEKMSVAYRTLQRAGIIESRYLNSDDRIFDYFRSHFRTHAVSQMGLQLGLEAFERLLRHVQSLTISNATIVCATVMNVLTSITKNFANADLVIVDEAARVPEPQMLSLYMAYPLAGKIFVGDHRQLGPVVQGEAKFGCFIDQMKMSFFERIVRNGTPTALFNVQYRAVQDVSNLWNTLFYDRKVKSVVTLSNRPVARSIREFNKARFGIERNTVLINTPGTNTKLDYAKSRYNNDYLRIGCNLAVDLMDMFGDNASLTYLSGYRAQNSNIQKARLSMMRKDTKYERLINTSIDGQ